MFVWLVGFATGLRIKSKALSMPGKGSNVSLHPKSQNVVLKGLSGSWLIVASLVLLPPQCGFTLGLPARSPCLCPTPRLSVRKILNTHGDPASKAFFTPRERKRPLPVAPVHTPYSWEETGLVPQPLSTQADNTLHQVFCSL